MSPVVSATTRFNSGRRSKNAIFLTRAHYLLREAQERFSVGDNEQAVESAYQAALRTAGAVVAASPVAHKRRAPRSAWDQLALVTDWGEGWATEFRKFSRLRSRLISGLPVDYDTADVRKLIECAGDFLDQAELGDMQVPQAA